MEILETKILKGPNCWSTTQRSLIQLKLNVDDLPREKEKALAKRVQQLFPGADGKPRKEKEGTPVLIQLLQHIALELQCMCRMKSSYSISQPGDKPNEHEIAFSCIYEEAGLFAAKSACSMLNTMLKNERLGITAVLRELNLIRNRYQTGPTTSYILDEIIRREIPFLQFEKGSLLIAGHGCHQKKLRTAVVDTTSGLGIELAGDKEETKNILAAANMPVPKGIVIYSEKELRERINEVRFPVVIKPLDGNHGRGVTTDIRTMERALFGYSIARDISEAVIVEEFIEGDDYRFLIIDFKLVAVAKRKPAMITGDGVRNIHELITRENENPDRGDGEEHVLAPIRVDSVTQKILLEKQLTPDSVLQKNEVLILKDTANISAGGTAEDVTDQVHHENKFLAERAARLFNLNICGLDIVARSIHTPISRETGAIIEVNAGPGLRMHSNPQKGKPRNVAAPILEMLFPAARSSRIPIITVATAPGSGTIVKIISAMASAAGRIPGFCSTEGININGHWIHSDHSTGYIRAQEVLFDPLIDTAILEYGIHDILNSGLPFDFCDVSILTCKQEDGISERNFSAALQAIGKSTGENGYAVIDAGSDSIMELKANFHCKTALFCTGKGEDKLILHASTGGAAALMRNGELHYFHGKEKKIIPVPEYSNLPSGLKENLVPAILGGLLSGFGYSSVTSALASLVEKKEH
jgi:cyanophycin synthetase